MIWPVIDIRGDKYEALKWLPYGRALLNRLVSYMNSAKLQQHRMFGYPTNGVRVMAERRMSVSRIYIEVGAPKVIAGDVREKYYWYHIITGGYRWYINDLCVAPNLEIFIIGGHAVTEPDIWYGDYAVTVKYSTDGNPIYVKKFSENTNFSFAQSCCAGEFGYIYMLVDYFTNRAAGVYETMLVKMTYAGLIVWDTGIGDSSNWTQVQAINVQHYEDKLFPTNNFVATVSEFKDYDVGLGGDPYRSLLLTVFNEAGTVQWKKFVRFPFTDTVPDGTVDWTIHVTDLTIDSDGNIYTMYRTQDDAISNIFGDFTITSWESDGTHRWTKMYRSDPIPVAAHANAAYELVADKDNNLYVIYANQVKVSQTAGTINYIVMSMDTDGVLRWSKDFVSGDFSNEEHLHTDVWARLSMDRSGNIIALVQLYDSSYQDNPPTIEDDDYAIASLSSTGELNWIEGFHGVPYGVNFGGMAVDIANDILIGGDVYSQDRSFTIKLPNGPITGEFHDLIFYSIETETADYAMTASAEDEDLLIEDATDMDIQTVTYSLSDLEVDTKTLYKFLETTEKIEVSV